MAETKHTNYTNEQKYEAIKLSDRIGVERAAKELSISQESIHNWRKTKRRKLIEDLFREEDVIKKTESIPSYIVSTPTMERFNMYTVAYVTGYSVGSVYAYACTRKGTSKNGLTVLEVIDYLDNVSKRHGSGQVDQEAASRLRTALEVMGKITPELELRG